MASTVSYDVSNVEEWSHEPADRQSHASPSFMANGLSGQSHRALKPRHDQAVDLRARKPEAEAEAGSSGDPWPRVISVAAFEPAIAASIVDEGAGGETIETAGNRRPATARVEAPAPVPPPPPRPSRHMPILTEEPPSPPAILVPIADVALAENDAAGEKLVRMLAGANLALPEEARAQAAIGAEADPMDAPPMIIERAWAEQERGLVAGMPGPARINPVPGLAVGVALSVVAGAVLLAVLTGG